MHPISFLRGVGLGAGLAYFLDPSRGRYRRALVRDQLIHLNRQASTFLEAACRDLQNRAEGALCEVRHATSGESAPDGILVQRIRSQMGRCVTHPRSIEVSARNGRVTLRGPILSREAQDLFQCVRSIRGVQSIANELDLHEQAGTLSALQGAGRLGTRGGLLAGNWSPGTRLLIGSIGTMLVLRGMMQRAPASCTNGVIGLAMLARAFTSAQTPPARYQQSSFNDQRSQQSQRRSHHEPEGQREQRDPHVRRDLSRPERATASPTPPAMGTTSDQLVAGALSDLPSQGL